MVQCCASWENDKGLYATMKRWRIDPSSCLDTCWVDDMAVWWFGNPDFFLKLFSRFLCVFKIKAYLCNQHEVEL